MASTRDDGSMLSQNRRLVSFRGETRELTTMPFANREEPFPYLDNLRLAYDSDAKSRNTIEDLQWRTGVLERWLDDLPSSPRLLELGPGTGQLASWAEELGARVHAIDLSGENVAYCRQRGISAEVGDFRRLSCSEGLGSFDGVYAINALLHVPRAEHASVVASARGCLVPGGGLLIVNWGGRDMEGIYTDDTCVPPRYFSHYDDAGFFALAFAGFDVVRRELLTAETPDGLHPQLLALRSVAIPAVAAR